MNHHQTFWATMMKIDQAVHRTVQPQIQTPNDRYLQHKWHNQFRNLVQEVAVRHLQVWGWLTHKLTAISIFSCLEMSGNGRELTKQWISFRMNQNSAGSPTTPPKTESPIEVGEPIALTTTRSNNLSNNIQHSLFSGFNERWVHTIDQRQDKCSLSGKSYKMFIDKNWRTSVIHINHSTQIELSSIIHRNHL